ncbi:MAG: hypothetical protein QF662_05490, partial [Phycisphaerae bacterium]|nr:hypothetical protein [Phycisphaerae bacterium]
MLAKLFAATLVTFLLFGAGLAADTADEASKKKSAEKAETKARKKGGSAAARSRADKKALEAQKKRAERIRKLRTKSTRRKLRTRWRFATLKFKSTPLPEVLKTLGKVGRFGVIIDPRLEKEEIDLSERLIDLRVPT